MLLWVSLFGVLALILGISALMISTSRAERRARRTLYRSLGLAETTVDFLMERNRDVLTELTYVRHRTAPASETAVDQHVAISVQRVQNVVVPCPGFQQSGPAPGLSVGDENAAGPGSSLSDNHARH